MHNNTKLKAGILNFALILLTNFSYSQATEISVRFIGNCGLYFTDGTSNLYVDFPYKSGAHNYMEYDQSELDSIKENPIFLFTHKHADHYSKKLLRKQKGKSYGPWNVSELKELSNAIPNFSIEAFRTPHKVFGISFRHYSYLITWHGKKIYLSGDTEQAETIASMNKLDWAFVPAWLLMDAIEKEIKLKKIIQMFAIYHIGPKDKINSDAADQRVKLLAKQGEIIRIPY